MRRLLDVRLPQLFCDSAQKNCWSILLDSNDVVVSINAMLPGSSSDGVSWSGDLLSPRGIDLQINGGLGLSFSRLTLQDLPKLFELLDLLWTDGVEAICPTFVSCEIASLRRGLLVLREARKQNFCGRCKLLGAHLEGPFLAPERHGAHSLNLLCEPSIEALNERINGFEEEIALVTLAPELSGAYEVIAELRKLGVVVAFGHSEADSEMARCAFKKGVTMLTHTFNGMEGIHHRFPGPVGAALIDRKVFMGLIADGIHVHPDVVRLIHRLAADQLVLVSDALAPYGLKEGRYQWDGRPISMKEGTCYLEDGTLAGVAFPLLEGCKRLAIWTSDPSSSIWAATMAPRQVLGSSTLTNDFLIGQSLSQLLRWKFNCDDFGLRWHEAA